ncbi:MAG: methyl-accepting chemotaxis protein [Simplicispira sp.]|nr:methyl-accepting chemotaxis protein [Simplicispira sp.]
MNRFRIATKLWLAVALIVILLIVVVAFSGYRSTKLQSESEIASAAMALRVEAATRWAGLTETNAVRTQAVIVSSDPAVEAVFNGEMTATSAKISEVQKSIEGMALGEADRAQMAKVAAARKTMIEARTKARQLKADGQVTEAIAFIEQTYNPLSAAYLNTLRQFVQMQQQAASEESVRLAASRTTTLKIAAVAVGLLLLAIVTGAYVLIRNIQRPLSEANALAARIAAGDLSARDTVTRGDEFGDLLRSLYAMSDALGRMVYQVRQSTDSIATASAQIATGNHDLSARTEQTASNLQETAAAMEQFTSTIAQSASSAQQASSLAAGASDVARRGGEVVNQVVTTMEDINHSSKKIADIIGVIDGIAFQTNILALNAAVEAARAGEQGRGFAVVASEVRSLAQRSAEAAKEIKGLINTSVDKVDVGTRLVSDAGTTMQDIVQSVQRVTDMIGEITAASTEQNTGVSQVNQAVGNLDQMTQQNAALVEESAAAAQSMREQAEQLARVVSVFKVNAAGYESKTVAPRTASAGGAARAPAAVPARASAKLAATPQPAAKVAKVAAPAPRRVAAPTAGASAAGRSAPALGAGAESDWETF